PAAGGHDDGDRRAAHNALIGHIWAFLRDFLQTRNRRADGPNVTRPAVTIVIPAWNAVKMTMSCLTTLRDTLGPDDQVVVVDNGSTDGTPAFLATQSWVEVVTHEQNEGFAAGC